MLDLYESAVRPEKEALFQLLMSGAAAPVYVLGRNKYAERVSRAVPVQAFVDDYTGDKTYLDKPVIRLKDLPRKGIVVSCVMDTLPVTALDKLQSAGVREVIDYFTLSRLAPDSFPSVDFCAGNRQDILENAARYQRIYDLLGDEISKQHFAKVVRFRLSMELEHMRGFSLAIDRQYFEDFLPAQAGEVFVDGGGFDGQTTLQFAARYPSYKRIHYFEPTPNMMEVSKRNLQGVRDVCLTQKGLFSRHDRLRFNADAGPANGLSPSGQTEIEVVRLDEEVREPITFLKLDIEGAEHEAIQGAAEHIRSSTPTLAVCIYHNQQDFWRVPQRVLEINPHYKLFVRHYSESIRETVMFFVPANSLSRPSL
jgi:FkbM family methyltransferase